MAISHNSLDFSVLYANQWRIAHTLRDSIRILFVIVAQKWCKTNETGQFIMSTDRVLLTTIMSGLDTLQSKENGKLLSLTYNEKREKKAEKKRLD